MQTLLCGARWRGALHRAAPPPPAAMQRTRPASTNSPIPRRFYRSQQLLSKATKEISRVLMSGFSSFTLQKLCATTTRLSKLLKEAFTSTPTKALLRVCEVGDVCEYGHLRTYQRKESADLSTNTSYKTFVGAVGNTMTLVVISRSFCISRRRRKKKKHSWEGGQ